MPRSEKAQRLDESAGQIARLIAKYRGYQFSKDPVDATDNTDKEISDREFAQLRALPEPVFRKPPSWRDFQQRENAASPSRSSETGGSQGEPSALLTSFQALSLIYFR